MFTLASLESQTWFNIQLWNQMSSKIFDGRYTENVYRALRVVCRFSLQYLWKRAVRITEKPYTPQRERLCMLWGNPVIFTDCGENTMITTYRISPQSVNITPGFPTTYTMFPFQEYRISLWLSQPFSIDIAVKTYRHPVNPRKHLQCALSNFYLHRW